MVLYKRMDLIKVAKHFLKARRQKAQTEMAGRCRE
jgi:hypothetical protein